MMLSTKLKVLLIEGERDSAEYIINLLYKSDCVDFEIVHKRTMADSLECVESEKGIDIILLDLILPNSKGIHAFESIKSIEDCENIPVVIISDISEIGIEAVKLGAQDFIPKKNITLDMLIRSMRYAIVRKKNELELKQMEERLRMALNATSDGMWDYDVKNNNIYFSDKYEELLGYENGFLSGNIEKLFSIMHPEDRDRIINQNTLCIDNKESNTYNDNIYKDEIRLKNHNGNYRWFLIRSMSVNNGDDSPLRLVGVLVDITDRKQEEEIREKSYNNLTNLLDEKLQRWNNEVQINQIKSDKKLTKLTNDITELINISK